MPEITNKKLNSIVSKAVREKYKIRIEKEGLKIGLFQYINIDFDNRFCIEDRGETYAFINSKVVFNVWKYSFITHTTIL